MKHAGWKLRWFIWATKAAVAILCHMTIEHSED